LDIWAGAVCSVACEKKQDDGSGKGKNSDCVLDDVIKENAIDALVNPPTGIT
jgi:hypothetical protein